MRDLCYRQWGDSPNISIYIFLLENIIFTEHKYLYIHFHMATFGYISIYRTIITLGVFIELQLLFAIGRIIAYREETLCYRQWGIPLRFGVPRRDGGNVASCYRQWGEV